MWKVGRRAFHTVTCSEGAHPQLTSSMQTCSTPSLVVGLEFLSLHCGNYKAAPKMKSSPGIMQSSGWLCGTLDCQTWNSIVNSVVHILPLIYLDIFCKCFKPWSSRAISKPPLVFRRFGGHLASTACSEEHTSLHSWPIQRRPGALGGQQGISKELLMDWSPLPHFHLWDSVSSLLGSGGIERTPVQLLAVCIAKYTATFFIHFGVSKTGLMSEGEVIQFADRG